MNLTAKYQSFSFTNLVELLQTSVERYADRPLFGQLRDGQIDWTTYAGFSRLVDQFRSGLVSLGIGRGDRVGVISNNRLEWAVGAHACNGLGASYVPMYEAQHAEEWQFILGDSGAVMCLVANDAIEQRLAGLREQLPNLRHVVNFEGPPQSSTSYASLMAYGQNNPVPVVMPSGSDVATLIYTSGTTGHPKGVVLTHHNLASAVNSLASFVEVGSEDRGVSFLPWAHVFGGCVEANLGIATGGSTVICGDALRLTEYLPIAKPTVLFAVPRVWNKIHAGVLAKMAEAPKPVQWIFHTGFAAMKKARQGQPLGRRERIAKRLAEKIIVPKVREGMGGNLRFAVSGAAALSREVGEFMLSLGVEVHEGYGLTETCGAATAQPQGAVRLGSVGVAVPGVRLELDRSVPSAGDDEGELIIYGDNIMQGYYHRDDATRLALTEDGGLRTGDLAKIDADGYVYITGRAKELYKLENGKYVAPRPIEEKLELSPYIAQAMVTGQDKPHNVALIIADMPALRTWAQGQGITGDDEAVLSNAKVIRLLEDEVERCNAQCKGYERIHDFIVDSEELTPNSGMLTQTLKLKRRAIVAKFGPEFESLYPSAKSERPAPRASYIRELRGVRKAG